MSTRLALLGTLPLLLLTQGPGARADQPVVAISYSAPAECPDAGRFLALLGARTAGSWRLRADGATTDSQASGEPRFEVSIRDDGDGKLGQVRRTSTGQASLARQVRAQRCEDVVQALALTTALSLGASPPAPPVTVLAAAAPKAGGTRHIWSAGIGTAALALLPPSPMLEARLYLEVARPRSGVLHTPDLRVTLGHARNDLVSSGAARFSLSSLGLGACPLGASAFRLCLEAEAGLLAAAGRQIDHPTQSRRLWLAVGSTASARHAFGWLIAEAFVGVRAPLRRADFVFELPRRPAGSIPAAVLLGGIALGRTIP